MISNLPLPKLVEETRTAKYTHKEWQHALSNLAQQRAKLESRFSPIRRIKV